MPLADAVKSYLFNAQLVTPPDGAMTLVAPTECRDTPSVAAWIERHLASNGAIRRVNFVDVRQSMPGSCRSTFTPVSGECPQWVESGHQPFGWCANTSIYLRRS